MFCVWQGFLLDRECIQWTKIWENMCSRSITMSKYINVPKHIYSTYFLCTFFYFSFFQSMIFWSFLGLLKLLLLTQIWLIRLLWMATVVHCEIFCTNVTIQWLQGKWKNCCKFFAEILRKFALHFLFFVSSKSPFEQCDLLNVYIVKCDWLINFFDHNRNNSVALYMYFF